MIRIHATINGTRYDTAAAVHLGTAYGGEGWHAFHERLFRTRRSGRFFLAGSGGALTAYAGRDENGQRTHGQAIIPLTPAQALEWAVASRNLGALRFLKDSLATLLPEPDDDQMPLPSPVPVRTRAADRRGEQPAT